MTGKSAKDFFDKADFTGFDIYPGNNVDVVGDAHRLSAYFAGKKFDLVFSSAVFEHLAMPWVAAEEIAAVLEVGGYVFTETHFSYSSHERPWHFFQFSDMGLRALFNPSLGFEVIDSGMSNPIIGWFTPQADAYLRHKPVSELYCHSEILARKIQDRDNFTWKETSIEVITANTNYPKPEDTTMQSYRR